MTNDIWNQYIESLKESENKVRFSADTIWKKKKEKLLNLVEAEMLNGGKKHFKRTIM